MLIKRWTPSGRQVNLVLEQQRLLRPEARSLRELYTRKPAVSMSGDYSQLELQILANCCVALEGTLRRGGKR